MSQTLPFDYAVDEEVGRRMAKLFEGLPADSVKASLEDFIDDYIYAQHGISIMKQLREVKTASQGKSVSFQPLAKGRAVLISAYGFNLLKETVCSCGLVKVTLEEGTREEMHRGFDC